MKRVIVIGGGPSGMMAAIQAARQGATVTLLERMEKPGKKLLITGNGRCNLTNRKLPDTDTYRSNDPNLVKEILEKFTVQDTLSFFRILGLPVKDRNGYVYPYTDQAGSVLEILMQEMKRQKVKVKCQELVTEICRTEEGFQVVTETWQYPGDCVILCAGGKSAPKTGSDGSGYELAKKCGHRVAPVLPALVPLKAAGKLPSLLSGTRNDSEVSLEIDGKICYRERGEVQWTDYGVSGIVIFQLSRYAGEALSLGKKVRLHIDNMPEFSSEELRSLLSEKQKLFPGESGEELLAGYLKKKMATAFLRDLGKRQGLQDFEDFCERIIGKIKDLTLEITGTKSFDMAQVCAGGVPLDEVHPGTLESKKMPGLYLAGELLDVDAICGGYNLQWAWSSGFTAGSSAGKDA